MNTGYDKNGYITDYSKLNAFDKAQLDNAIEALELYCNYNRYELDFTLVETRIDGSYIIGTAILTPYDQSGDVSIDYDVDFNGGILIKRSLKLI
jgi:hypothetical protein